MSIFPTVGGGYAIPGPAGPGVPPNGAMMVLLGTVDAVEPDTMTPVIPLEAEHTFGDATTDESGITVSVGGIYRVEAGVEWEAALSISDNSDRRLYCEIGGVTVDCNVASGSMWPTTVTINRSMYVAAGETIGSMTARHSSSPDPLNILSAWLNAFLVVGEDDLIGS